MTSVSQSHAGCAYAPIPRETAMKCVWQSAAIWFHHVHRWTAVHKHTFPYFSVCKRASFAEGSCKNSACCRHVGTLGHEMSLLSLQQWQHLGRGLELSTKTWFLHHHDAMPGTQQHGLPCPVDGIVLVSLFLHSLTLLSSFGTEPGFMGANGWLWPGTAS